jgi:tRNA (guanine-N7-)-methyltransferase
MRREVKLPLEQLAPYLLEWPAGADVPTPLDWAALFGNAQPVELEIGFGKGLFLLNTALAQPSTNFVGIEIVRKYQLFAANRIAKRVVPNVRLACGDGHRFLAECVPAGSLHVVHVYFPDPWWKKRHHKRRLFTTPFVELCCRALRVGGILHFATDVEDYFHMASGHLAEVPALRPVPPRPATTVEHDMDYLTNFERKARKQGKPIFRTALERVE